MLVPLPVTTLVVIAGFFEYPPEAFGNLAIKNCPLVAL
jgi:hypothetical protein